MAEIPLIDGAILRSPEDPFPNLLGRGVAYPLQRSVTGGFVLVEGEELVRQSILSILSTSIGERPFMVRSGVPYGTRIKMYQFENVEQIRDLAAFEVRRALEVWEPRISVTYVEVTDILSGQKDPRYVGISVTYRIRATNRADNLVVPIRRQDAR